MNAQNQRVKASQEADVIQFEFTKDGESYGTAWVTVDDAQNIIVYYDSEQQDSPSTTTPGVEYDDSWTGFLKHLKNWAQRRQMSFELANKDRLGDDMRQREYYKMKERLGESYHPMGKKASYNDAVPNVKIVLQHNRSLEEGEARFRNVARIYLENVDGERFLAPTTRPGIARVYARHIAEGGLPNDDKWNHIKSICEDYNKMAGFVRATRNGQFNESAQQLVQEGVNHYNNLRETLHKLTTHKGYHNYFESYTPPLMEGEGEDLSEMFMSSSMDPRIEAAMPILSRLQKPINEMSEVDSLAEWADNIISEKLELSENKFTVSAPPKFPPTEFEATTRDEAVELASKRWRIPAEQITVHGGKGSPQLANAPEPDDGSPLARAEKKAKMMKDKASSSSFNADDAWSIGKLAIGLSEMDKEHGSKRDFDNARGPDKTAKPMTVKQFAKGALKSLNRGMKGWEKGMHDVDTVKAATKSLSPDQKEKALGAKVGKGSPAELQQKLIKREKNKKVDEGTDSKLEAFLDQYPEAKDAMYNALRHFEYAYDAMDHVAGHVLHMIPYSEWEKVRQDFIDYFVSHGLKADANEDQLDEIDSKTLQSYADKSFKAGARAGWAKNRADNPKDFKKASDTADKRVKGLGMATKKLIAKMPKDDLEEDLGPEQKRVGQLGPTEKVKNNNIGKLVGVSESKEIDPELARIIEMAKFKR